MEISVIVVIILVLVALLAMGIVAHFLEVKRLHKQIDDLMDRMMSPDFQSYLASQRVKVREQWKQAEPEEAEPEDNLGLPVA